MRLTVAKKIFLGAGFIVLCGLMPMTSTYFAIRLAKDTLDEVTQRDQVMSAAAYEMEINVIEGGKGVLNYLQSPDPAHRHQVEKDESEFQLFKAKYEQLAKTPEETQLTNEVDGLFQDFISSGKMLMRRKDHQEALNQHIDAIFAKIDDIIDYKIQSGVSLDAPDSIKKIVEAAEMEVDIAEVGTWLGSYLRTPSNSHESRIVDNIKDFETHLARFKSLRLSPSQKYWSQGLDTLFRELRPLILELIAVDKELRKTLKRLIGLQSELDKILDDRIQTSIGKQLAASSAKADRISARAINILALSIPVFVLFSLGAGWLLMRQIRRPLENLIGGTESVAVGDLDYRVAAGAHDEFGDLIMNFNAMVAQLQETTVSKDRFRKNLAQVQTLHKEVKDQAFELEKSNKAKDEFLSVVSHELRTPLNVIMGYARLINETPDDAGAELEVRDHCAVILRQSTCLLNMVNSLLDAARIESNSIQVDYQELDLADFLAEVRSSIAAPWDKDLNLVWNYSGDPGKIKTDARKLKVILANLINNAIKFTEKGSVTIAAKLTPGNGELGHRLLELRVTDTGVGMAKDQLTIIFDKFKQLDSSDKRTHGGVGLGLYIVKRFTDLLGGAVEVESEVGKGTVFAVKIRMQASPASQLSVH